MTEIKKYGNTFKQLPKTMECINACHSHNRFHSSSIFFFKTIDSSDIQMQLKNKLEELFMRENLEKDVYLIARMNDKMEIPLQVVYQQKEIYKICPNGRYVLQALKQCSNLIVNQEQLYVIPKIVPNKVRIYIRISDQRKATIDQILTKIQEKSQIHITHTKVVSPTSAFLTVDTEETATALSNWIADNKVEDEPLEIQLREENLHKVFRNNVKEDLAKYYEKLNEDKKSSEMYDNLSFFSNQSNFPTANKTKVGENIFSNPFNYFFFQQSTHEHNLQPSIRKGNGDNNANNQLNNQFNPLAFMMFQQQQMFNGPQNSRRNNNHIQSNNGKNNKNNNGNNHNQNNRSKSRGQVGENNNQNNSLNRSKSRKRQNDGGKAQTDKKNQKNNNRNRSGEKVANNHNNKDQNGNKKNHAKSGKKGKNPKPIVDNEENFPSLLPNQNSADKDTTSRQTRKQSAEKRQNAEASPARKEVTIKVDSNHKRDRQVSESKEKQRDRQVSESRERQLPGKIREKSASKADEVVYVRKGKDIKVAYEKESLIEIFKQMKERIAAPSTIVESSKDDFIPVININAPKEIEHTKATEVELLPLSNPGTPYQNAGTIPYRKSSISRSNIKRKESASIIEVDENKL